MPPPPSPSRRSGRSSPGSRADGNANLTLLNIQLIVVLFIVSVVMFAVVATLFGSTATPGQQGGTAGTGSPLVYLAYIAVAVTAGAWVLGTVIHRTSVRQAARRLRTLRERGATPAEAGQAMFMPFATGVIMRAALVEGGGLLGAMAVFLTGNMLGLAGVGLALIALVAVFPTQTRIERFTEEVTRTI